MVFVVIVHLDGGVLGIPDLKGDWSSMTWRELWRLSVEAFTFIGVNCFTLISGYFGIRLRWRTIATYLFQCIFYAVGIYLAISLFRRSDISLRGIIEQAMVLTHTDLWYVPAYFILMLLSPFINAGFEIRPRKNNLLLVIVFTLFNFWAGWWWGGKFNASGYTPFQLIMIYCIGRSIASYKEVLNNYFRFNKWKLFLLIGYLIATLLTITLGVSNYKLAYSYNQPAVVIASVFFFLLFSSFHFHLKLVNYVAKSAFAVYLLHKSPLIWGNYIRPWVKYLWNNNDLLTFSVYVILITLGVYIIAMLIDPVRRKAAKLIFRN